MFPFIVKLKKVLPPELKLIASENGISDYPNFNDSITKSLDSSFMLFFPKENTIRPKLDSIDYESFIKIRKRGINSGPLMMSIYCLMKSTVLQVQFGKLMS